MNGEWENAEVNVGMRERARACGECKVSGHDETKASGSEWRNVGVNGEWGNAGVNAGMWE